MTLKLSTVDHQTIDRFLDTVLDRHAQDRYSNSARDTIAHLITMIASDDDGFRKFMAAASEGDDDA